MIDRKYKQACIQMSFLVRRNTEHIQSNLSYVTFQGNSEI